MDQTGLKFKYQTAFLKAFLLFHDASCMNEKNYLIKGIIISNECNIEDKKSLFSKNLKLTI